MMNKKNIIDNIKTIIVAAIVFLGAAFAIMTFNEDVSVMDLFQKIYKIVEGTEHEGLGILEFMYGVGIAVGITVFYNHFGSKKGVGEPTPLELKMQQYEDDVEEYMQNRQQNGNGES